MEDKNEINLGSIQETLLLPLWGRAIELDTFPRQCLENSTFNFQISRMINLLQIETAEKKFILRSQFATSNRGKHPIKYM